MGLGRRLAQPASLVFSEGKDWPQTGDPWPSPAFSGWLTAAGLLATFTGDWGGKARPPSSFEPTDTDRVSWGPHPPPVRVQPVQPRHGSRNGPVASQSVQARTPAGEPNPQPAPALSACNLA